MYQNEKLFTLWLSNGWSRNVPYSIVTCANCYPFKVIHYNISYNNKIGNSRRKNKQIVVHPATEYYSAVSKREADLYLMIWKDLQVKKHVQDGPVCVKHMCIYLGSYGHRLPLEGYTRNW